MDEELDIPVIVRPFSADELETMKAIKEEAERHELERQKQENAKLSALTKLEKLGLTVDEANAIIGNN